MSIGFPGIVRNPGLDLPTFEESEVKKSPKQFKEAAAQECSNFVRRVHLYAGNCGFLSLKNCLYEVDVAFDEFADNCNSQVVKHQWGLYATEDFSSNSEGNLLPDGYKLGARVNTIIEDDSLYPTIQVRNDYETFLSKSCIGGMHETSKFVLNDLHARQFMLGEEIASGRIGSWLVDIDIYMNIDW